MVEISSDIDGGGGVDDTDETVVHEMDDTDEPVVFTGLAR
jgi:hypothetical protein